MEKFLSLCFAVLLVLSNVPKAFAHSNVNDSDEGGVTNVVCLSDDVSAELVKRVSDGVKAYVYDSDGNCVALDCDVSISRLAASMSDADSNISANAETRYQITASVTADKVKTCSKSKDYNRPNVTCTMFLSMEWLDRTGLANAIERLSGNTSVLAGTCTGGCVRWGYDANRIEGTQTLTNPLSFDFDPDFDQANSSEVHLWGAVYAEYRVTFSEEPNFTYMVSVAPSIFS